MMISDQRKSELLKLAPTDITKTFMIENFANRAKKVDGKFVMTPAKYNPTDTFYITPDEYFVKTKTLTTIGRFIYNKLIIERDFQGIIGYMNSPITGSKQNEIEEMLSEALMNDKITTDQFASYVNRIQWLGMQFNSILSPTFTEKSIMPIKKVIDRRDTLFKENETALANGDINKAVQIENELLALAKEEMKNDPAMDLYESGARGSFNNNYKAMYISKGPVFNPIDQKWDVVHNCYSEGVEKKDMPSYGNSLVTGQYSKSLGTPVAGYLFKRMNAAFQAIVADVPGSDCGTKLTLKFTITSKNKKEIIDRYIVENGKLVLLTDDNIDKYVGKTVNLRSTMYCMGENKCSKCLGERFYKVGIKNVGLVSTRASTTILNLNMKKFHDATAKLYTVDINNITL